MCLPMNTHQFKPETATPRAMCINVNKHGSFGVWPLSTPNTAAGGAAPRRVLRANSLNGWGIYWFYKAYLVPQTIAT